MYKGVNLSIAMSSETKHLLEEYVTKHLPSIKFNKFQHITLIYSNKESYDEIELLDKPIVAKFNSFQLFGAKNNMLVIELDCNELVDRHHFLLNNYDIVHDYSPYRPHCTLSYKSTDIDLSNLPIPDFDFIFNKERIKEIIK